MQRFKLEKSTRQPSFWVLTDTENMIVCRFREHQFNETQQFTDLEQLSQQQILQMPTIMREMGDWMATHHYNIAMPVVPFCFQQTEDDQQQYIERAVYPKFRIMVDDTCEPEDIAAALEAAAAYIRNKQKGG